MVSPVDQLQSYDEDEEAAVARLERLWDASRIAVDEAARFSGSLSWKANAGVEYLVHVENLRYEGNRQRTRSLGPRSEDTERRFEHFRAGRERTRGELSRIRERLAVHGRVLKALRLGRVSALTARFLRELADEGFGPGHFRIGGGAALAAYEFHVRSPMPIGGERDVPDFDLLPTEMFVRDRSLFDAIAARKIFGPVEDRDGRLILGRGVEIRLLYDDVPEEWGRTLRRSGCGPDEVEAVAWAFHETRGLPLLAVGLDGSPAPVPALDPRAFSIIAAVEARHLADGPEAERLMSKATAVAAVADRIVDDPFERVHLALFPELAATVRNGGMHDDAGMVMRP